MSGLSVCGMRVCLFFLMIRRPPRSTRTDTLFPYTTLFRSEVTQRGMTSIGQVKMFYMAGSAIPVEVAKRFLSIGIVPQNIYGMTENGSHQYTLPNDSVDTMVRTCGRACSAYEVKIWNSENTDVETPKEIGRAHV